MTGRRPGARMGAVTSRRSFLRRASAVVAATWLPLPACVSAALGGRPLRFGLCADVHQDVMHDAVERISAFAAAMAVEEDLAFVAQLGDFARPVEANRPFLEAWNTCPRPRHHVIGNHDLDGGCSREEVVAFFGMPARYYGFTAGGCRFLVLDGNDRKPEGAAPGYPRWVGPEQIQWLREELAAADGPVIVLSHQSLENPNGLENGAELRALLESANAAPGGARVLACFSGHHHLDYATTIRGIHYVQVNSMSYYWVGGDHPYPRYSAEVDAGHPWIKYTAPYRDPLWMLVTLTPDRGLRLEGVRSEWVGPSPQELGAALDQPEGSVVPWIRDRIL
ncbi:MAG: alkaline phosphatase [Planctomycetota bacterium]|nr:MAG: alkaline phosphatase [Planctomycetota bacterium]